MLLSSASPRHGSVLAELLAVGSVLILIAGLIRSFGSTEMEAPSTVPFVFELEAPDTPQPVAVVESVS
jgi:hypothetical protein